MNLKNIALGIAVIILTSFVTIYGIDLIYTQPDYNNYCDESTNLFVNDSAQCITAGGFWNSYTGSPKPSEGYCDLQYYCRQDYDAAMKAHYKHVFYLALPIGVAVLIAGAVFFGLESVGAGLMGGGIVTLIYGAGGYWQYAQNWLKFLISLAGLVVVIYFAYWFNKRSEKMSKNKKR